MYGFFRELKTSEERPYRRRCASAASCQRGGSVRPSEHSDGETAAYNGMRIAAARSSSLSSLTYERSLFCSCMDSDWTFSGRPLDESWTAASRHIQRLVPLQLDSVQSRFVDSKQYDEQRCVAPNVKASVS